MCKAAETALPTVVAIRELNTAKAASRRSLGSGVIISADGLVLSQYHVTHMLDMNDPARSRKAGEKLEVILRDGRQCQAELLGGDRTYDLSLLRLVEPKGPFPFAPIGEKVVLKNGDGILKLGHPLGYRPGRDPVVRFGRVLCAQEFLVATDCLLAGGDSGGPYFDLDGHFAGIAYGAAIPARIQGSTQSRGDSLNAATTIALIQARLPNLLNNEVSATDGKQTFEDFKNAQDVLPTDRWSQGSTTRGAFREVVGQAAASVVAVRDAHGIVALGTIVDSDGFAVTKASVLPAEPRCELPDGQVVAAEVLGIEPAFDVALLKFGGSRLKPIQWQERVNSPAGTFVAALGPQELPIAVGVVSVPTRDLKGPFPSSVKAPPRRRAALPEIIGSAVQGRGYWVEYVDGRAAEAGIQPGDVLLTIGDQPVRAHADLAQCVAGRWADERLTVRLLRAATRHELTLRLRAEGQSAYDLRVDSFPTVFEHDAPLLTHECGGPVLGLDGKALGITIARIGPHGCTAIPSASIKSLVADLKSGTFAEKWTDYRQELLVRDAAPLVHDANQTGEPVTMSLDELKDKLRQRREKFHSLLVEYDVVAEAHVDPSLLVAWQVHQVRDYQEFHRMAFSGTKRLSEVRSPSLLVWNAPLDRVEPDPNAPVSVIQAIEQQRLSAIRDKQDGRTNYLFQQMPMGQQNRYIFDGTKCFAWDPRQRRMLPKPTSWFHSEDMYLTALGLRPIDPEPSPALRQIQQRTHFSENFALYERCRILPTHQIVDGAACLVVEGAYHTKQDGQDAERIDRIWLDPSLGLAPRRWETSENGQRLTVRMNSHFDEPVRGCWLPRESKWTFYAPAWVVTTFRNQPTHSFTIRLWKARINDLSDDAFEP